MNKQTNPKQSALYHRAEQRARTKAKHFIAISATLPAELTDDVFEKRYEFIKKGSKKKITVKGNFDVTKLKEDRLAVFYASHNQLANIEQMLKKTHTVIRVGRDKDAISPKDLVIPSEGKVAVLFTASLAEGFSIDAKLDAFHLVNTANIGQGKVASMDIYQIVSRFRGGVDDIYLYTSKDVSPISELKRVSSYKAALRYRRDSLDFAMDYMDEVEIYELTEYIDRINPKLLDIFDGDGRDFWLYMKQYRELKNFEALKESLEEYMDVVVTDESTQIKPNKRFKLGRFESYKEYIALFEELNAIIDYLDDGVIMDHVYKDRWKLKKLGLFCKAYVDNPSGFIDAVDLFIRKAHYFARYHRFKSLPTTISYNKLREKRFEGKNIKEIDFELRRNGIYPTWLRADGTSFKVKHSREKWGVKNIKKEVKVKLEFDQKLEDVIDVLRDKVHILENKWHGLDVPRFKYDAKIARMFFDGRNISYIIISNVLIATSKHHLVVQFDGVCIR